MNTDKHGFFLTTKDTKEAGKKKVEWYRAGTRVIKLSSTGPVGHSINRLRDKAGWSSK